MNKLITEVNVIHNKTENPIFGESITSLKLEDEGGGPFLVISQNWAENKELRLDMDELLDIVEAAKELFSQADKYYKENNLE